MMPSMKASSSARSFRPRVTGTVAGGISAAGVETGRVGATFRGGSCWAVACLTTRSDSPNTSARVSTNPPEKLTDT